MAATTTAAPSAITLSLATQRFKLVILPPQKHGAHPMQARAICIAYIGGLFAKSIVRRTAISAFGIQECGPVNGHLNPARKY
jgi:hypothetical protein